MAPTYSYGQEMVSIYLIKIKNYNKIFQVNSQYHLQGTTFVSFSSFTSTLKLKAYSQLTQSPVTGTDCLLCFFWLKNLLESFAFQTPAWIGPD